MQKRRKKIDRWKEIEREGGIEGERESERESGRKMSDGLSHKHLLDFEFFILFFFLILIRMIIKIKEKRVEENEIPVAWWFVRVRAHLSQRLTKYIIALRCTCILNKCMNQKIT